MSEQRGGGFGVFLVGLFLAWQSTILVEEWRHSNALLERVALAAEVARPAGCDLSGGMFGTLERVMDRARTPVVTP